MSPIDAAIVRRKLGHLMTSLDLLRTVRTMTIVEYRADVWRRKGIERMLWRPRRDCEIASSTNTIRSTTPRC